MSSGEWRTLTAGGMGTGGYSSWPSSSSKQRNMVYEQQSEGGDGATSAVQRWKGGEGAAKFGIAW
jgi:hypothetical protein